MKTVTILKEAYGEVKLFLPLCHLHMFIKKKNFLVFNKKKLGIMGTSKATHILSIGNLFVTYLICLSP